MKIPAKFPYRAGRQTITSRECVGWILAFKYWFCAVLFRFGE
jgi:hypothetical protein